MADEPHVVKGAQAVVDWTRVAWFMGCDMRLSWCGWLLTRCHEANDVETLASEVLVRRAVALKMALDCLTAELRPAEEGNSQPAVQAEWTSREIVRDVVALIPNVAMEETLELPAKGAVLRQIENTVIAGTTALLKNRINRDEEGLLEQWIEHVQSLPNCINSDEEGLPWEGRVESRPKPELLENTSGPKTLLVAAHSGEQRSELTPDKAKQQPPICSHEKLQQTAPTCSGVPQSVVQQLTADMNHIYALNHVSESEEAYRKGFAQRLEKAFRINPKGAVSAKWPQCQVLLFGSSLSKFGSKTADLDLCLRTDPAADEANASQRVAEWQACDDLPVPPLPDETGRDHHGDGIVGSNDDAVFLRKMHKKSLEALAKAGQQRKAVNESNPDALDRLDTLIANWVAFLGAVVSFQKKLPVPVPVSAGAMGKPASHPKAKAKATDEATMKLQKPRKSDMNNAAKVLRRFGCNIQCVISRARVPVIKFMHPRMPFECDLCLDNYDAFLNTQLLRAYAEFDDRARVLGIAVKHWAKKRGINDAASRYLSSYSFILLTIYFLQTKARILPNLQHPELRRKANVAPMVCTGVDVSFCTDRETALAFHRSRHPEPSTQSVGDLLLMFFQFYVEEFDFDRLVVSVRDPDQLQPKIPRWGPKMKKTPWRISIEDPLDIDRDVGSVLLIGPQRRILEEMKRALTMLCDGKSFQTRVCESRELKT